MSYFAHAAEEGCSLFNTSLTLEADAFVLGPLLDLTTFVSPMPWRYSSPKHHLSPQTHTVFFCVTQEGPAV